MQKETQSGKMEQGKCIWVTANCQNTNFPPYKENLHEFQHGSCQRSHLIVKVKRPQFRSLFLNLHLFCFHHISLSSISPSEGWRSVSSSSLIYVIRNAVWELRFSPTGTVGLLLLISVKWQHGHQPPLKICSKWRGTSTSCLFKGVH